MFFSFSLHVGESEGNLFLLILKEVILDGFIDTLKIIPFLFLTYLFMEFLEHRASDRMRSALYKAGSASPLIGGLLGAVPQCGFSAAAANLYTGRVISLGTLIAVFLSTSDEMLPILISGKVPPRAIILILLYKLIVGAAVGYAVDIALRLTRGKREKIDIDALCDEDGCHCENGILRSALHHTLTVGAFVLSVTLIINLLVTLIGADRLSSISGNVPVLSHIIAALVGLIPNCAASVLLCDLAIHGIISVGTMLSGLFSGAGVGILILFKINKHRRENLMIILLLVLSGAFFGLLTDITGLSSLFDLGL